MQCSSALSQGRAPIRKAVNLGCDIFSDSGTMLTFISHLYACCGIETGLPRIAPGSVQRIYH